MKFSNKYSFGPNVQFWLVCGSKYANLYFRICALRIVFKLSDMIGHSKQIKFPKVKFAKKNPLLGKSFNFWERTVAIVELIYHLSSPLALFLFTFAVLKIVFLTKINLLFLIYLIVQVLMQVIYLY